MCMLNGRSKDSNEFTSISTKGLAVVDYCLVPTENFALFQDFAVWKILDILDKFSINVPSKLPDHSILFWKLNVCQNPNPLIHVPNTKVFKRIPEDYLRSVQAHEKFHTLTEQVSLATNGDDINCIYADFCALLDSELLLSHGSSDTSRHRHKPWWNSNLSSLRKKARSALKLWSRDKSNMSNKEGYLKAQKEFDKQVNKARKAFIRKRQDELLLDMTKRPRSFWKKLDAISIHQHRKKKQMPERILDSTGSMISERSEVLRIWKEHFDNLLNTGQVVSGAVPHNLPSQIVFSA